MPSRTLPRAPWYAARNFVGRSPGRVVVHVRLELDLDLAASACRALATLTLTARRDRLAVGHARRRRAGRSTAVTRRRRAPPPSTTTARSCASCCPGPAADGAQFDGRDPLRVPAAPRPLLHRARRGHPDRAAAVLDAGPGRRLALLLAVHRPPDREVHDRGDLHGARGQLRAVERRPARAQRAAGDGARALALRARVPAARLPGDAGRAGRSSRSPTARRATGVDVFYFAPPGREADARRSFARTPADDRLLLGAHRRPLPVPALQPDRRRRLHLRRHGEHDRDDADRAGAARRARRARPRRRRAGRRTSWRTSGGAIC